MFPKSCRIGKSDTDLTINKQYFRNAHEHCENVYGVTDKRHFRCTFSLTLMVLILPFTRFFSTVDVSKDLLNFEKTLHHITNGFVRLWSA